MYRSPIFLLTMLLILLLAACAPAAVTPEPIVTEPPGIPVTGVAIVQSVEIKVHESAPVQVQAILRGQLPDAGCTTIASVEQVRNGNTFDLTVRTTTDPVALCAQALTPFEHVVALDVSNLPAGKYMVRVSGIEQDFEIPTRDVNQFKQQIVDALNARDFDGLKSMMGESFLIGYWQSEGVSNTPEQAIEQLQRNLLPATGTIASDPNKDLVALLGADPVKIVGPDVVEASPLFTSGWGAAGKDEVILFTAKRPNGDLYWYGILFARDGFVMVTPTPTAQPVDTNAYPTNVKFVMAERDVRMRNGPGTQFGVISFIAAGQTAKVTGVSANGYWWRVICPDNSVGSCWVSADPTLTRPTNEPVPDTTAYPTNVKFVMAQQDVTMYSGPGTQFSIISYIAGGQTARVTGVSANGNWWRVICPDNSVGSCWISANPSFTKPTDLTGTADVQSVEIQILESYPLQVNAIARGYLPDAGCTTIADVSQSRNGNTFTVTLRTKYDPQAFCALTLTLFEHTVPLDVSSLLPGTYIVRVSGVETSFQLPETSYPTEYKYALALHDVMMYSGPGAQYSLIGSIASGQTAKLTGVSADGSWWRVICPDNSVGNCWVSANPADTQPTQGL